MPKLTCLCGESINLSPIPNPDGLKLIPEQIFDTLVERLVEAYAQSGSQSEFEQHVYAALYRQLRGIAQAYECPACGRLAVFAHASDTAPAFWWQLEKAPMKHEGSLGSLLGRLAERESP